MTQKIWMSFGSVTTNRLNGFKWKSIELLYNSSVAFQSFNKCNKTNRVSNLIILCCLIYILSISATIYRNKTSNSVPELFLHDLEKVIRCFSLLINFVAIYCNKYREPSLLLTISWGCDWLSMRADMA